MIKKDSEEYQKIMAKIEAASSGVAYEEPYERVYKGENVVIYGYRNNEYIGVVNGRIIYIQAGDLF